MYSIKLIPEFSAWLSGVNDSMTHRRLARRLEKAQAGNLGDVKPVGEGVFEMREHFGPGWRMYYVQRSAARCSRVRHFSRAKRINGALVAIKTKSWRAAKKLV